MGQTIDKLPEKIGKYTQLELIGEGACAKVFKAFDSELERHVALKLLSKHLSADAAMQKQFHKEIKVQASLNIPGIVKVFDCGSDPAGLYYTMELVNGMTLDKYCWDNHLSLSGKLKLIASVASIVDKLHGKKLLHRDIKPRNIMIDEYGNVKLLDMGLVAILEEEMSLVDNFKISGSPAYMPPEALEKRNVNVMTTAADVYSLCVMAYEIISAQLPYDVDFLSLNELSEVVNNEKPHPLETPFKEKIPPRVEKTVMRGLDCHPGQRPSAREIADAMNSAACSVGSKSMKVAAIVTVSAIAVVIVYHLTVIGKNSELEIKQDESPLVISNPDSASSHKRISLKTPDSKAAKVTKIFYKNSYPAGLRDEWEALKNELSTDKTFKKMGALYYKLPDKCLIKFKVGSAELRSIDSRFEKAGSLFYDAGKKLTIEIRKSSWDKPEVFCWIPSAGNADVFCPVK